MSILFLQPLFSYLTLQFELEVFSRYDFRVISFIQLCIKCLKLKSFFESIKWLNDSSKTWTQILGDRGKTKLIILGESELQSKKGIFVN